jgi:two-component system sensor histidine kinase BaeS
VDAVIARRAVVAALVAGIGAEILFDNVALGSNFAIATIATLVIVTLLGRGRPADPIDWWLPAVAIAASLGPALRTDPNVVILDTWLSAIGIAAWSFAVSGVAVTRRAARAVALMGVQAGIATCIGFAWLLTRVGADGALSRGARSVGRAAPILRGAVIAVPILLGFAVLLGSADAVFGHALDQALRLPNVDDIVGRAAFAAICAVLVAGPITIASGARGLLGPTGDGTCPEQGAASEQPPLAATATRSGATEAVVVLLAVDLLFAAFAVVQVVYLFGGTDTLSTIGMTYSDYARQGYFQLVGVVALAGLLLLGAHEIAGRRRDLLMAGLALLVLTGVILASAALRLRLYQDAYGWTELRFFVAVSIGWLAAALVIAILLLASNRMRWVAHGLAISAVVITLAISAIGPQAFVMDQNIARALDPGLVPAGGHSGFDLDYGLTLGDDSIPALVAALDRLPSGDRMNALAELWARRHDLETDGTTSSPFAWNLSRERARAALVNLPLR